MAMETPSPDHSQTKSRTGMYYSFGIGFFLLALLGCFWLYRHRNFVWTNDAHLDGYQITISADINARLITLYVDEGDVVKTGQILCQLDESIYNSQKAEAESLVALLREQVESQKIQMEKLRDIYHVAKQEYLNEIISYIDFDKIEKDFRFAESQYKVSHANLANGIAKLGVIEEYLRHTKVYAPRDGAIAKRWVVAGDAVQFGQPLFSLTDTQNIWVTANFEETKLENVTPGDPVKIHVDAYPDMSFMGTVYIVRASAASKFSLIPPDNATGNFTKVVQRIPVKILLNKTASQEHLYLYPGMSVEVDIRTR